MKTELLKAFVTTSTIKLPHDLSKGKYISTTI